MSQMTDREMACVMLAYAKVALHYDVPVHAVVDSIDYDQNLIGRMCEEGISNERAVELIIGDRSGGGGGGGAGWAAMRKF